MYLLNQSNYNGSNAVIPFNSIYKYQHTIYDTKPIESYYKLSNSSKSNLSSSLSIINPFNNDVQTHEKLPSNKQIDFTDVLDLNDDTVTSEFHDRFPLFFINRNLIKIPSKIHRTILRHIPKSLLREIHKDIDVAIEMCLIFTTQLVSTYFEDDNPQRWKSLKAGYLRELISVSAGAYKKVIEALEYPLDTGAIIECDHKPIKGEKCHHYRFGEAYFRKGLVRYQIKTKEAQRVLNKHYFRMLSASNEDPICRNLIRTYSDIVLPTIDQIKKEAKRLIKEDYRTKKGKALKFLNKHPKSYYKHHEQYSFVEDAIEIFEYLTDNGLMIPVAGSEKSGGRIVDSFTLMPSWIRRMVKLNNRLLVECDYTALHPNIAIALYGGKTAYLSHGDLENKLKIKVSDVKIEHLSFFNKTSHLMKQSPLYEYYVKHEPEMLKRLIREKFSTKHKHKITCRRMFKTEVDIMTDVVTQLNDEGINILYVYDALLCHPKAAERVLNIMDETVLRHGVKTKAKCSSGKKYNPLTADVKDRTLSKEDLEQLEPACDIKPVTDKLLISADEINFSLGIKEVVLEKMNAGNELNFVDAVIRFFDGEQINEKVLRVNDPINPQLKYVTQSFINKAGHSVCAA